MEGREGPLVERLKSRRAYWLKGLLAEGLIGRRGLIVQDVATGGPLRSNDAPFSPSSSPKAVAAVEWR